jgi:hypothetical protein
MEHGLTDISFVSDNLKDLRRGEMTSPPGSINSTASAPKPRATVTSPSGARMGWMAAATPTIASPLKRLLPSRLPSPTSSWPRQRVISGVTNSGSEVPTATTRAPIT